MTDRLQADTIVDDRYRILYRVGSGGMADVYCAEDQQLGRRVALKILYPRFAQDEEFVERFRREASSAAGLQHPNVVSVFDRGAFDGTYYIAMEYLEGRSLKQVINEESPMDPARAIDLTIQVLRAARFAHKRGIIHRDLKPQNVIVDDEGRAKVTDFGIARAGASDMTQTGSIMGTAQYLSPEQAQGHAVSQVSDLYAVGIILYELLTGRVPFDGDSAVSIALKQVSEQPVPPAQFNAAVTPELEYVDLVAMAKDPAQRYQDADQFIAALEQARANLTAPYAQQYVAVAPGGEYDTGAYPPAEVEEEQQPWYKKWWVWLIAALAVAGIVIAILLLTATKQTVVPKVVGEKLNAAEQIMQDAGFKTDESVKKSNKAKGTVISTDPAAGTKADHGSTVKLVVSGGPGKVTVPPVDGQGQNAATDALEQAGFKVKNVGKTSSTVPAKHVISTDPAGNTQANVGSTVVMYVSTGQKTAAVPNVVGSTSGDASTILKNAGFTSTTVQQTTTEASPGTVIAQDPGAGSNATPGTQVTLTVAKAPSTVTVPDVTGQQQDDATSALEAAGFQVKVKFIDVDTQDQDGIVQSQNPSADSQASKNATVTIVVGQANVPPITTTTSDGGGAGAG
jgi:serine/threonine-protein kinase